MAVVYRHIRLDTGYPFYIGIGNNIKRAYSKYSRSNYWNYIVNKYGYEVEILFNDLSWEMAIQKEKEFIKLYGRMDNGGGILINFTDGGEGSLGVIQSEESNENNPMFGKKHTNETKEKIRQKRLGSVPSVMKKVYCLKHGKIIKIYNSLTEAAKDTNSNLTSISMCCNGKRKESGGYNWKFIN